MKHALPLLALLVWATPAHAHTTGESFFEIVASNNDLRGRWELALRDLDDALTLDADGDGRLIERELDAARTRIAAFADAGVLVATSGPCARHTRAITPGRRSGVPTAVLDVTLACPPGDHLGFESRLFFERDSLHRAFVSVAGATEMLSARHPRTRFALAGGAGGFRSFVASGMWHIWQGLDHVLFLIVLLLPAVLRREANHWQPAPSLRVALADVARVVTAFTVAHSLTLGLAAAGLARAAPSVIEPAIAASVLLAAANNLYPIFGRDRWLVAFALGLLHGFGFSSVLADVGLPRDGFLAALFGFNLGVELGQLALVALIVPLAFLVRHTAHYRRLALVAGSGVAAAIAAVWFVERII